MTNTVDPLAGSYYVENLTNTIEENIINLMAQIDNMGGMVKAIQDGYIQTEILNLACEHEVKLKSGEKVLVGVNKFVVDETEKELNLYKMDAETSNKQIMNLERVKAERDDKLVMLSLEKVKQAALTQDNIMPSLINAVKAYATVGEITDILKDVFGTFCEPVKL